MRKVFRCPECNDEKLVDCGSGKEDRNITVMCNCVDEIAGGATKMKPTRKTPITWGKESK